MSVIKIIKKFKSILSSHQKLRIFQLAILMIIGGLLETCSVSLMLPFMDVVMNPDKIMAKWYVKKICEVLNLHSTKDFIVFLAVILAILYIVKNGYLMFQYHIQSRFVYGNMFAMQRKLLETIIRRPYEYFLELNSGEIMRIVNTDTVNAFSLLMTMLSLFTELVVSLMLVASIFIMTPVLTVSIAVLLIALVLIINFFIKPVLRQAGVDLQNSSAGMNKWLLQSVQGIKELKVMNREEFFENNYNAYGQMYIRSLRWNQTLSQFPRFLIEGICMAAMFIAVAVLIYNGTELETVIPILTAVAMAAIRLLPSVNRISSALAQVTYNEPMLDKMIENLEDMEKVEKIMPEDSMEAETSVGVLKKQLEFEDISYHYPNTGEDVLTDSSMKIYKGESIGIVGASGAGKTTAVDIILGLLQPQKGKVKTDGVDIRLDLQGWLGQIGYIPQMIFMLDDTIRANVAFGEPEDAVSEDDVWRSLKEAALDDFVRSLPDGLDTEIGERGMRLSGGQKQRIGIARALYRNPEILIFDEATSALDNDTESAIMESINNLQGKKTMIIIAHRLSTIESCDHVFRVENRGIVMEK